MTKIATFRREPIIQSLLDLDFYKLTMLQFIWHRHRDVPVTFEFKNRTTSVRLAEFVKVEHLIREFDHVLGLRFTDAELTYLAWLDQFDPEFLAWLRSDFELSALRVQAQENGQLRIVATGPWSRATLWETPVLSIVNELYYRWSTEQDGVPRQNLYPAGHDRLHMKCVVLMRHPDIKIMEFGTRRRFSRWWQREVVRGLRDLVPYNLLGTSNVLLAKELGIQPRGTFAHELEMVYSGIYRDDLRASHQRVLEDWWQEYGEPLSIALTETYTSDFFFEDMTDEQARMWRGLRQDSGDPFAFADKAIAFYTEKGIDPKTKTIVFSDGLDIETIVCLADHCRGRIGYAFGWGTNLTNDLGPKPLSLIMKVTQANGHGCVKLSDNLAKAQGTPEDVELFKRVFGHAPTINEECRY